MKGIIDYLVSDTEEAIFFRNNYIIKIIPMLNPDGVIIGNFRTSISGKDLNRRWKDPSIDCYPEVFYVKELIKRLSNERTIDLILDLHGHSGEYNVFCYGNIIKNHIRNTKIYPYYISKSSDFFFYSLCKFKMPLFKYGTARIALFNELGKLKNIVCIEASCAGINSGTYKNTHWSIKTLISAGGDLLLGFNRYLYSIGHKFIRKSMLNSIQIENNEENEGGNEVYEEIYKEIDKVEEEIENEKLERGNERSDSESGGSESDPSIDNYEEEKICKFIGNNGKNRIKSKVKKKGKQGNLVDFRRISKQDKVKNEEKTEKKENLKMSINIMLINNQVKNQNMSNSHLSLKSKSPSFIAIKQNKNSQFRNNQEKLSLIGSNSNTNNNLKNKGIDVIEKEKEVFKMISKATQTESIFFRFKWEYFKNDYKILSSTEININIIKEYRKENKKEGNLIIYKNINNEYSQRKMVNEVKFVFNLNKNKYTKEKKEGLERKDLRFSIINFKNNSLLPNWKMALKNS